MNKRISIKDIVPGFKFNHCGLPATIKHISEKGDYALFLSDDGSEHGTIAVTTLIAIANRNL